MFDSTGIDRRDPQDPRTHVPENDLKSGIRKEMRYHEIRGIPAGTIPKETVTSHIPHWRYNHDI
jgi:hypothetical protein